MNIFYIAGILAFCISLSSSFIVSWFAKKIGAVDFPDKLKKKHEKPTPLLGGISIFISFFVVIFLFRGVVLSGNLTLTHWLGVFLGALVLMLGGIIDDKYNLSPKIQLIFPLLAVILVLAGGVGIEKITNPFGNYIYFNNFLSGLVIVLWLLGMMYTTKLLDGVDGLVTGVGGIGALVIFLFTMTTKYYQPDIGFASLMLFFASFGFLVRNWHPAKIFLGEGGSLLMGFLLGVLAIISGGKIAIAFLIMGVPILDVAWTIIRRLRMGKNPFKFADRKHLHHRILDTGIGQRKTVLIFYGMSFFFGLSALFLQSLGKIYAMVVLVLIMFLIIITVNKISKKNENKNNN